MRATKKTEDRLPATLPIIAWIGGKRRLAPKILPMFPEHICYVEPFAGAAALLFAKEPSKVEVLNDINGDLVNLYRVVKHHLEEFVRQFRWALVSRQIFKWLEATPASTLTDIQAAARFYYLQRACFGSRLTGRTFGIGATSPPRLNLLRIEEDLSAAHLRLSRVTLERSDWSGCVARYDRPQTLFYMDPPYFDTQGYGVQFEPQQYERLAQVVAGLKGKAILSINDVPEMRKTFSRFRLSSVVATDTLANPRSAGKLARAPRRELIVRSW